MPIDRALIRKTVGVYAETLKGSAPDEDAAFALSGELEQILSTIRAHMELRDTLMDHTLPKIARQDILKEIFSDCDPAVLAVLAVMIERGDIHLLPQICERYVELVEEALDAIIIDVATVVELDDRLRDMIKQKYSAQFGRSVLLREHIDPSLVGGIVLSAHGSRIDASVNSLLENARTVLAKQW